MAPMIMKSPAPAHVPRGHSVLLTWNRAPNTRSRLHGCEPEEKTRSFTTFPVTGTCSFIVYGDSREQAPLYTQSERHKIVADRIADEQGIQFVVNSGDLVADSDDRPEWLRFFNATDKLRSRTTYIAVPGNHDQDRALFRDLFGMAEPYSFDCGNARILLLDSTDDVHENLTEQAGPGLISIRFLSRSKDRGPPSIPCIHPMKSITGDGRISRRNLFPLSGNLVSGWSFPVMSMLSNR